MTIVTGKVVNGRIEVEDVELPEGLEVSVYYPSEEAEVQLSAEELAELNASIAEADRGELIPAEDVLREIRAMRDEAIARRR
ncbi:MAG TPA: hypothetical protein VF432_05230 [Thermoanaerobaculia bacterium]